MARRIPPLNALRAFEAAARHESFTRAAEELCVTQGAISRHVSLLEQHLGVRLFVRGPRGVELTPKGASYRALLCDVFDRIDEGTKRLREDSDERRLKLKSPPTFAIRWLVPRLARFHALYPEIEVQITTSHSKVDFLKDDIDVCIQWGEPPVNPSAEFRFLFGEVLLPVCSPSHMARCSRIREPRDLGDQVLLSSLRRPDDWATWFAVAGASEADRGNRLTFENSALTYQAALDVLGFAIAQEAFVREDLKTSRLVCPIALRVPTRNSYSFGWAKGRRKTLTIIRFEEWICEEADKERELMMA